MLLSPPGEITPKELIESQVGKEFFKDFTNPNDATSITVVSYDEASATSRRFAVSFQNGKWTIPSHHNYPADGQDRLAKTASSVKGIKREELASTSKQVHEQLGVIDPLDKDRAELKGRGQRLMLKKGEDTLVDLIIGKQVKERPGFYYVRKPDEDATFVAKLDINLSTKFSDWIETDLLKLNRDDLTEIVLDNYSIDKTQGVLVKGDVSKLERDKSADPWKLEGLDEAKEEVDTTKVTGMMAALDDLKIVGVRPKPKGFKPDLTLDPEFANENDLPKLARDLQKSGFFLSMDRRTKRLKLFSDQGDLLAATNKGVVYTLRFGDVFLGDESEIEIGGTANKDAEKKATRNKTETTRQTNRREKMLSGKQSSRYLFVTASFDESYLGDRPVKPEPPAKAPYESDSPPEKKSPEGSSEEKPEKKLEQSAEKSQDDAKPDDKTENEAQAAGKSDDNCTPPVTGDDEPAKEETEKKEPERKADAAPDSGAKKENADGQTPKDDKKPDAATEPDAKDAPEKKPEPKPEQPKKSAADLQKEYKEQVKKYEADLKSFEDKVAAGKKQANELNDRFSGWYYVISSDYFNKLHLSRKELVKDKTKPADGKATNPVIPPEGDGADDDPFEKDSKEPKDE